ncbi:hypothetical protein ACLB1E_18360 [Escherichia coli]
MARSTVANHTTTSTDAITAQSCRPTCSGPHDNFHPSNPHVIPALLRRFHEATARCTGRGGMGQRYTDA